MLEAIFQDGPHLSSSLVVKERVKAFVNKFLDQAGAFCQSCEMIFFLISQS